MPLFKKSNINNKMDKSANKISTGLFSIFSGKKIDDEMLDELEELLITSDLGIDLTNKVLAEVKKNKYSKDLTINDIKIIISKYLREFLKNSEKTLTVETNKKPYIILFIGVNGVGKTTVIGKIANNLKNQGKKVLIAAGDTFRAGAVEQLDIWAKKSDAEIVKPEKEGADPSSIAYKAFEKAESEGYDVLLIDTAGRMHNNVNLMQELAKINRILHKNGREGADEIIAVLDATTGQNAERQIDLFNKTIDVSGIIMNKLDGTARGGILVSIFNKFKKPIYAIGIGEGIDDLQEFNAEDFIENLLRIE